jgi:hypothetical protein
MRLKRRWRRSMALSAMAMILAGWPSRFQAEVLWW